ncbi:MAG TPA: hypothetical protein VKB71_00785, partial [Rhizomicrobium sp.]|nr:hypothetical protein [Rhizomicrobium sp.]
MATTTMETPTFTMGGVASATFGSIGRNFATFALLALLAEVPQQGLVMYMNKFQVGALQGGLNNPAALGTFFATTMATSFLTIIMAYVLQAAIVYGTVTDLSGRRASFGSSLSTALKVLLPLIGLSIVSTLGVMLGLVLLVVPGIILALGWAIAVPVRVIERTGVFASLSRSWQLTSGYKGTIFLLFLVFTLASLLFSFLGQSMAGVFSLTRPAQPTELPILYFVYFGVIQAVSAMVGGAGVATMYY